MLKIHIDPRVYPCLILAWFCSVALNWYLIEKTIRKVRARGPFLERIGIGFPFVQTSHPACPAELKAVYQICMRWIYIPAALLMVSAFIFE
jgi:hypothetical protein